MGAFEQLFGPVRGEFEQKCSKNSNARGVARGGMLKLRFDWYITAMQLASTSTSYQNPAILHTFITAVEGTYSNLQRMIYLSLTLSFLVLFSENFKEAREVVEMTKVIYETSYEDDKQHILAMMSTCTISV